MMLKSGFVVLFTAVLFSGCNYFTVKNKPVEEKCDTVSINPVFIKETYTTLRDTTDNVDSPAFWFGDQGQSWLLATAKETDKVIVYDATTGNRINSFGKTGSGLGCLSRPNGIAIIDSLAIVVERDNHRLQIFTLPEFKPIGIIGENLLRKPYGVTVDYFDGSYNIFVTDNYEMNDETIPPLDSLGKRVLHFTFIPAQGKLSAVNHVKSFGDTHGEGVLYVVESILIDRVYNRLLIADEYENQRNIKVYDLNGKFTGKIIPNKYFSYEPEGIALWSCVKDSSGYYITTDQDKQKNTFHVFDRETFSYAGCFSGKLTRNTDGIALTQKSFGRFPEGAFFPVHDDGSVSSIGWDDISSALNLK